METFTNGCELLPPGVTRFATHFIALDNVIKHKNALRDMWDSDTWTNSRFRKMTDILVIKVRSLVLSDDPQAIRFW